MHLLTPRRQVSRSIQYVGTLGQVHEVLAPRDRFQVVTRILAKFGAIDRNPTDDRYLECAAAGEVSLVINGDQHLLDVGEYQGIQVLRLAAFLTLLKLERKVC